VQHCEALDMQLSAYIDGELEGVAVAGVEAHLKECLACATLVERERRLQAALRRELAPGPAPERLRASVAAALHSTPTLQVRRTGHVARWVALAASIVLAVLGGREWGLRAGQRRGADTLADAVLAAHVRSLQEGTHLTDVPSSDHHTVKPWFTGKLDYGVPVPALDSLGYPLVGGRLDYVDDHPAAALVYRRGGHVINLFVWPSPDSTAPPSSTSRRGYHTIHGAAGSVAYWAISDVNEADLARFAELVRADLARSAGGR
jgi:anti-sigma factor RsiW